MFFIPFHFMGVIFICRNDAGDQIPNINFDFIWNNFLRLHGSKISEKSLTPFSYAAACFVSHGLWKDKNNESWKDWKKLLVWEAIRATFTCMLPCFVIWFFFLFVFVFVVIVRSISSYWNVFRFACCAAGDCFHKKKYCKWNSTMKTWAKCIDTSLCVYPVDSVNITSSWKHKTTARMQNDALTLCATKHGRGVEYERIKSDESTPFEWLSGRNGMRLHWITKQWWHGGKHKQMDIDA